MKTLNEILFINEVDGAFSVSWLKPEFHGGESVEISQEDAARLTKILTEEAGV